MKALTDKFQRSGYDLSITASPPQKKAFLLHFSSPEGRGFDSCPDSSQFLPIPFIFWHPQYQNYELKKF